MDRTSQSHRLLQVGVGLILMAALAGLAIPNFAVPRLALSAHLIGLLQGILLLLLGSLWARLDLTRTQCTLVF